MQSIRIEATALDAVVDALVRRGYTVVGPRLEDGAIVYDEVSAAADLPAGWTEEQEAAHYRVRRRADQARFGYTVGPHAWKRFLLPSALRLWRAERDGDGGFALEDGPRETPRYAFLGVRPCDLAAIFVQDRVFMGGAYHDVDYRARREATFVVAVHCTEPGGTCFCESMGTGPRATGGYDLAMVEVVDDDGVPYYLVDAGSELGREVLAELPGRAASDEELVGAERLLTDAAGRMGRRLDTMGLGETLARSLEHPRWDEVAARCLACGNCTLACPTCFCTTVVDTTDLTGAFAERTRVWDSCFTQELSYVHGGPVRPSIRSRYRQWATHKLGTWMAQFGTSGCIGCGRCITWCPAAIDITEEAATIAGRPAGSHLPARQAGPPPADVRPGRATGEGRHGAATD